jgi:hypothetical protein
MEISRSRIVKGCLFALFARIGTGVVSGLLRYCRTP